MSEERSEFDRLMEGVRAGDEAAARQLYEQYGNFVLRVVRRKLAMRLRSQYDSTDFLQSVMASFFAIPNGRCFASPDELIDFLGLMAANKVADVFRRRIQTKKHDLNREKPLEGMGPVAAAGPTPSQEVMADECWERLLRISSPALREVLHLRRAGLTNEQIATRTGMHVKVIQRRLSQLDKRGRV